ncbi:HAD-IB family phosphatase [Rouxiella sp. Mn2063]|uniref:HAD-IB family phosphatase n=1 Tax=Rouxiella sp. Mn2063 TaxID=3395262 RepID=UPI003BDB9B0B
MLVNSLLPKPSHVVFDFDLTLLPEESSLEVLNLALTGHKHERQFRAKLAEINAESGKVRPAHITSILALMRTIHKSHINNYVRANTGRLPEEMKEVFRLLKENNITPWILSNAYIEWVRPLAMSWGIDAENIVANRFIWLGNRALCMRPSALMKTDGKTKTIRAWRARGQLNGGIIMVGDGDPDRHVYMNGQSDGFIQADYFTHRPGQLPVGNNAYRASQPKELLPILKKMLNLA